MKFKVGDKVIITAGDAKGKKSVITELYHQKDKVKVKDVNLYVKHIKPMPLIGREGDRVTLERPVSVADVAILNEKGEPDRIGYKVTKKGDKVRIYKKTGKEIEAKNE